MAKRAIEKRRLIKFSNYSMCVTLPKWVIDQLAWKKGDELLLHTDIKTGKITLHRNPNQPESITIAETAKAVNMDLKPIPKLRW